MILSGTRSNLRVSVLFTLSILALLCAAVAAVGQEAGDTTPAASAEPAGATPAGSKTAEEPPPSEAAETPVAEAAPAEGESAKEKPAEEKPAEEKAAEGESADSKLAEGAEPLPDFTKLAEPAIAERLQLSDEQQAQVATLLTERTTAAAAAEEAEKAKVLEQSDRKLAAVLSAEQLAEFKKLKPEPRLRFNFRFERWEDVLSFFAKQADLSLVLDAPPPGTFNYSDTKEYTPTEAIDLLNGVLLTKGYTLVRRGRMLVVVNLKNGVPEGIVPKVSLKELEKRGKFELVTVAFPLGRRPAETVTKEISPLLSPNGKVVPMPATSQILVTDTAGIMRAIGAVIESIAEPPVVPTPEPESPVTAVYPIKPAEPKTAVEVLTAMAPGANIVLDEAAGQIHVHAVPSQQSLIKEVLEQMKAGHTPEKQPRLETYPIAETGAEDLLATLKTIVPDARLTSNPSTGKLVVWAAPEDQKTIKETIVKLEGERSPARTRQFEVYRLTKADPDTALGLLKNILPDARLAIDAQSRMLIAVAVPADHEVIRRTLSQLQPEKPSPNIPDLRYYPLALSLTADSITALKKTVPRATIALEANGDRLMVVATPSEHEKIKATIGQIETAAFAKLQSKLVVYPVTQAQRKRFMAVLSNLQNRLPGIRVIEDAEPGELSVWASPPQHEVMTEILEELKRDVPSPEKYELVAYPITSADPANVLSVLKEMFPDTKLVLDEQSKRLLVWTRPAEQASVKAALENIDAGPPAEKQPRFEVYRIRGGEPSELLSSLQSLVPDARLSVDPKTGNLIAWATPEEQEKVKAALGKLQRGGSGGTLEETPQLEVYRLTKADPDTTLSLLKELLPDARLSVDAQTRSLIALAVPADQRAIEAMLTQLQPEHPDPNAPDLRFYALTQTPPESLLTVLKNAAPQAQINLDSGGKHLTVLASPADHDVIKKIVEKVEETVPLKEKNKLVIYPVTPTQRKRFDAVRADLTTELPGIKVVADDKQGELAIWAKPTQHVVIAQIMEQLKGDAAAEEKSQLVVYQVTPAQRKRFDAVMENITEELPGLKVITDAEPGELAIWARPSQQIVVGRLIEQLRRDVPEAEKYQLVAYQIKSADPASVLSVLKSLFPNTQIVLDPKVRRLAVWTHPQEQAAIRSAIEQLDSDVAPETLEKIMVYPVRDADPTVAIGILQEMLPEVKFQSDATAGTIIATGREKDQQRVKQILEQLQIRNSPEKRPRLEVYRIDGSEAAGLVATLQPMVPKAQLSVDPTGSKLVAWGTPEEHETLKTALEKMGHGGPLSAARQVEVYRLTKADPETTLALLQTLVPAAKLSTDPQTRSLVALATLAEHRTIRGTLEQLQPAEPGPDAPQLRFYPLIETPPPDLVPGLQQLAPKAQITLGTEGKRLMVVASPDDHKVIQAALEKVEETAVLEERNQLVVYPVTAAQRKRFEAVLGSVTEELPGIKVITDAEPGELSIWAKPTQHIMLTQIIDQLKREVPAEQKYQLVPYPIRSADPESVLSMMQDLFPGAKLVLDKRARRLLAWTRPEEHQAIKSALQQMDSGAADSGEEKFMVHPISDADPAVAIEMLQQLLPEVKFKSDTTAGTIVAWARVSEHEMIAKAIEQMQVGPDQQHKPKIVEYPAGAGDPAAMQTMLQALVPSAQVVANTKKRSLVALATPKEHETIAAAVKQMSAEAPEGEQSSIGVYSLETGSRSGAYYWLRLLREAVPGATYTLGSEPGQLIAWARPKDHELIKKLIEQMSEKPPPEKAPKLVVYTLKEKTAADAQAVLEDVVPHAELTVDGSNPHKLNAWAAPPDHEMIESVLKQIDVAEPPESIASVKVYTLETSGKYGGYYTMRLLRHAVPEASFTVGTEPNQLIAWARPKDHELIQALLDQVSEKPPPEKAPKLVVYTLKERKAADAQAVLEEIVPNAELTADGTNPQNLNAWAVPSDHATIEQVLAQIDVAEPPETAASAKVYTLESTDAESAIAFLQTVVPEAQFSPGSDPHKLIAFARPAEHEKIKSAVEQLSQKEPPETAPRAEIYTLESSSQTQSIYAIRLLREAVPGATFTLGADANQLIVWARPKDHELIKQLVDQMGEGAPPEKMPKLVVYSLKERTAADAIAILQTAVPDAQFTVDADPQKLNAWARSKDHQTIQKIVAQIDVAEPAESAHTVEVYTLKSTTAAEALPLLTTAFPSAQFTSGSDPRQLIAWARPAEHQKIKAAVEQMSTEETAAKVVTYALPTAGAAQAVAILTAAVPTAQLTVGVDPGQLIAYARPADHEVIKAAVEELEAGGLADSKRVLAVYPMRKEDVPSMLQVLDPALTSNAKFVTDPDRDSLIVWADPKTQTAIKNAVDQFLKELPEPVEPTSKVYRFRNADPQAALTVLTALVPEAKIALDATNRSLVVSALADDHQKIQETIAEMDREDTEWDLKLQIHRVASADLPNLLSVLQLLFNDRPEVQLSADQQNDAVIAVATPADHQKIRELIAEVEAAGGETKLQLYSLKNVDSFSVMDVLNKVLKKQAAKVDLSIDTGTNQLIAIARPEEHELIRSTLEQLRTEDRQLEIFQLDFVEPATAQLAINNLFRDEGFGNIPDIDSDVETQQLFVRGTKEQLQEIRALLIKLGETGLTSVTSTGSDRLRVIPFHGDAKAAVAEIERIWPQLRDNPIRVVAPAAVTPLLRPSDQPEEPPKGSPPVKPAAGETPEETPPATPQQAKPATETSATPETKPETETEKSGEQKDQEPEAMPPAARDAVSPVLVVLGEGSITIASEDPAALDQFESLLRTLMQRTGYSGRDFSIFTVRNTSAASVATTLTQLFRTTQTGRTYPYGSSRRITSRVVIVPDERLNTILVKGSRAERSKIEDLLKILDTVDDSRTLRIIPLRKTNAGRMQQALEMVIENNVRRRRSTRD